MLARRSLKPSRIPTQWEQVTPEWMTAAIARHHPDARVGEVAIVTRDDGTNRRARFGLTYAAGSGPATLFLKAHARRAVARDFTGVGVEPESAEPNGAIVGDHRLPRERRYYNVFANTDSLQVLSIEAA